MHGFVELTYCEGISSNKFYIIHKKFTLCNYNLKDLFRESIKQRRIKVKIHNSFNVTTMTIIILSFDRVIATEVASANEQVLNKHTWSIK